METDIKEFTVEELIANLLAAAKASSNGLDASVRLQDWEGNLRNIKTFQVKNDSNGDVLICFNPNEVPLPKGGNGASEQSQEDPDPDDSSGPQIGEELYAQALEIVRTTRRASVSHLQRKMGLGYIYAVRIIDMLEERGVIGPQDGDEPRAILIPC